MQDLQEVTHDLHYENYRASRLGDEPEQPVQKLEKSGSKKSSAANNGAEAEKDRILQEKELELQKMQQMIAQMQAQLQAQQQTTTTKSSSRSSHKV